MSSWPRRSRDAVLADAARIADALRLTATDRALLILAACAHDVVYDARPGDDERASARWASCALDRAGLGDDALRVEQLVLSTLAHEAPQGDPVTAALLDADLGHSGCRAVDVWRICPGGKGRILERA